MLEDFVYGIFWRPAPDVAVLTVEKDAKAMNSKLAGWENHAGESDGMGWLRSRIEPNP